MENKEGSKFPVDDAQAEYFINIREKEATKTTKSATKKMVIPENVVTRIAQEGMDFGPDYETEYLKQYPDFKRIARKGAPSPDMWAQTLKEEGYDIKGGDDLIEKLKTSEARNVLNPEKQDAITSRKLKRLENDYIERELANLEETNKLESRTVEEYFDHFSDTLGEEAHRLSSAAYSEAIERAGYSAEQSAEALKFYFSNQKVKEINQAIIDDYRKTVMPEHNAKELSKKGKLEGGKSFTEEQKITNKKQAAEIKVRGLSEDEIINLKQLKKEKDIIDKGVNKLAKDTIKSAAAEELAKRLRAEATTAGEALKVYHPKKPLL